MYQALYRKWRPKTFSQVVGQDHITKTLKNEIASGRIGHAYLFIGSRGTGKTTCAKIFAKAVNCQCPNNGDPCLACSLCKGIDSGAIMDIVELDAASNNSVNDIRELCKEAQFTPSVCKYRVYIIDEVHMLSIGAFNALLKTLEEAPEHVVFILATTEAHKVPLTIVSRCQRFEFYKISAEKICERLRWVAEKEGINLEKEAALLIAKISDGALRDALSLLDKCISISQRITEEIVAETAGLSGKTQIFDIAFAIIKKNAVAVLEKIDELNSKGKDMARLCEELIQYFRDIMLIKTMQNAENLILVAKKNYEEMLEYSNDIKLKDIIFILELLQKTYEKMGKGINTRSEIEICLVKLCNVQITNNLQLQDRLENLEKEVERIKNQPNLPVEINNEINVQNPETKIEEIEKEKININLKEEIFEQWPKVLEFLSESSKSSAIAFKGSVAYISGGYILIDAKNALALDFLRKQEQREKMRQAIKQITGKNFKLGPYKKEIDLNLNSKQDELQELANLAKKQGIPVQIN